MMDKITKYFTTKAEKVDKRVLRFVGSDEGMDRDGDQIMLNGWNLEEYKENPVVLFAHDYQGKSVANGKVWKDNKNHKLMFDLDFAPPEVSSEADSLYKLYKSGFMRAVSVGFRPDFNKIEYPENKNGEGPYRVFKGQTLLEISLVSVGSNSRALLTSKSMNDAVESKIIDQLELDELLMFFEKEEKAKPAEKVVEPTVETDTEDLKTEPIQDYKKELELKNAEIKIMELELQLAEQKMDSEIEEDDLYESLFNEFVTEPKKQKEELLDELLEDLR